MRIKKKHIQEDIEKAQKLADKEVENIGNIAKDIEGAVSTIAGDDEADEMSSKIAKSAIDLAYAGEEDVSEGDDAVDRGIDAGINPEASINPKNLSNDFDGQKGGPDYGQKEDPSKPVKGDLPFDESVDEQISEGDDNIHSRIQALKVQIARTKDPKKLTSLKDWLGKEEKLAASKTNKSINESSVEAYNLHRMANNVGEEVAAEFLSNHKVNLELLKKAIQQKTIDKYELRDVIKGDAHSSKLNKFMKDFVNKPINPRMTKNQLSEAILGKKKKQVIKTFKVKDLRNE